jgi:predicted RNA methylase
VTEDRIRAAAERNRAARLLAIESLRPMVAGARAGIDRARDARERGRDAVERVEAMARLKWVPGFFPTPPAIVAEMIEAADLQAGLIVLEPSAGKGDIARAILRAAPVRLRCIEIVPALAEITRGEGVPCECADFLTIAPEGVDRVIMNPPFERRQDEKHVHHALRFLNPGGVLVSIVSSTTGLRLSDIADEVRELPAGSFRTGERPTGVNVAMVIVRA